MEWVHIRSWHIIRTWTRVPGRAITLCGRTVVGDAYPEPAGGEATCETCFRIREGRLYAGK
jgi:hypothetical protein